MRVNIIMTSLALIIEELADLRDEIIKLQDQYSDMGLTDKQKDVINNLLKLHTKYVRNV